MNAENYNRCGAARGNQGDIEGAMADLTRAIELDPHLTLAYQSRESIFLDEQEYRNAIVDYTRAINLAPHLYELYVDRAIARYAVRDAKGAIADLTKALRLSLI